MPLNRLKALLLLSECSGDDIWSLEHCHRRDVPEAWLAELTDCFESGFDRDDHTIYLADTVINQYRGIRDVDLAIKLGEYLGVDVASLSNRTASRAGLVRAICEAAEEE